MFIVELTYKKPMTAVEPHIQAHFEFLDQGYEARYFICSGPKPSRDGGVVVVDVDDLIECRKLMQKDPFYQEDLAEFHYTPFLATKRLLPREA